MSLQANRLIYSLIVLLTFGELSFSLAQRFCSSNPSCKKTNALKFYYVKSKSYVYEIKSAVTTSTINPDSKKAGLSILATAKIGVVDDCEFQLDLSGITLTDDTNDRIVDDDFTASLLLPVRFEWNDGLIGSVCPTSQEDSEWSLNFKRSVLSALQNSMDSLDDPEPTRQIDASGDCWANYEIVETDSNRKVISWSKDLNHCADRHGGLSALFGVKYSNPMSDINTLPLTNGKQLCVQTTEKRVISKVECEERLEFLPTQLQDGGVSVVSIATMKLKLSKTTDDAPADVSKMAYTTSLKFDHSYVPASIDGDEKDAEALLNKMCEDDGVVSESGRELSDLVDSLRSLSKEELEKVYKDATKCKAISKILQSIISDIGTAQSGLFIVEKLGKGDNDPSSSVIRENWLSGLRVVRAPSAAMLEPAAAYVASNDEYAINGRAYLGVGSAIHNFCFQHSDCAFRSEVKAAVNHFANKLDICKPDSAKPSADEVRKAVYALRALANAGSAAINNDDNRISHCMVSTTLPADIRIAALTAFRRVPCREESHFVRETYRSILTEHGEDSEIRAIAFMSIMRCPSDKDMDTIRTIISDDSRRVSEKLGAFIVAYLDRTAQPPFPSYWSSEIGSNVAALLKTRQALELLQKVDGVKRGASYHRHHFMPRINTGYLYDVDVIHSEKSIMPRQLLFNLTVGLFGRAINPIEIGIRQEGLESIIDDLPDLTKVGKFEDFSSEVDLPRLNPRKLKPVIEKLKLSLFVRIFGDEVRYADIDKSVLQRLKTRFTENINTEMFSDEQGRQASDLFFDKALSLPTCSGLPLRLSLRGTYRSQIRPNMHPKVRRDSLGNIKSISINADVKAGLVVELRSSMAAFLGGRQFGIQAVTRMVSKAEYKPEFTYEGRHVKLKVGLPSKTIRDASISNEVFVRRDKTEEPIEIDDLLLTRQLCSRGYSGLKLCMTANLPSRWNGIMTPGKASMTLEKVEESTKAIDLEFRADHSVNQQGKIDSIDFKIYADTPGSSTARKVLTKVWMSRPKGQLAVAVETPWKKADLDVSYRKSDDDNTKISASLSVEGPNSANKHHYNMELEKSSTQVENTYKKRMVSLEITKIGLDRSLVKANCSVVDYKGIQELSLNVADFHIPNYYSLPRPLKLIGEIGKTQEHGYGFMLKGQTPSFDFESEFSVKFEPQNNHARYSHRFHHQSSNINSQTTNSIILWEVEFFREPLKKIALSSLLRAMNTTYFDNANHRLTFNIDRPTLVDHFCNLELNIGRGHDIKRYKASQRLIRRVMPTTYGFDYSLTFAAPSMMDRSILLSFDHEAEPTLTFTLNGEVRRGDVAMYQIEAYSRQDNAPGFGEFKLRTLCPFSDYLLHFVGERKDAFTRRHSIRLERNGDLRFSFESLAHIKDGAYSVDASMSVLGMKQVALSSRGRGSLVEGQLSHDSVLSYGARKLMLGGDYTFTVENDKKAVMDANIYLGTLQKMFRQYANYEHDNGIVKLNGLTELEDDLFHISGQFNLPKKRYLLSIEGSRSSTEFTVERVAIDGAYQVSVKHLCPNVELTLTGKAGISKMNSVFFGNFAYKLPEDDKSKIMGFHIGHKAIIDKGIDLGISSGIRLDEKEWFAGSNVTLVPGKVAFAFGLGNGDKFRQQMTIMVARRWKNEHNLQLESQLEFHSTTLEIQTMKMDFFSKLAWSQETGKLGVFDSSLRIRRGDKEFWGSVFSDAMNPRKAMTIDVNVQTPFTDRAGAKLAYTVSLPNIVFTGNARYGSRIGRIHGLVEVNKCDKTGVDLSYTVAAYSANSVHAEVSIGGQHIGDLATKGTSFITLEFRGSPFAVETHWSNGVKKMAEIVLRTPIEDYEENIIRFSGSLDPNDANAELLVKVGQKEGFFSGWRKAETTANRGEVKVEISRQLYSLGYSLDCPKELWSLGEYRFRLRADTPFERYRTSTLLLWFNPFTHGLAGVGNVLGLNDDNELLTITNQRAQVQIAYALGDAHEGDVLVSALVERSYQSNNLKLLQEMSVVSNLPFANFSFDVKSTIGNGRSVGWLEYHGQKLGAWRWDWTFSRKNRIEFDARGTLVDGQPVKIKLTGSHDLEDGDGEASAYVNTNIKGYEQIRLRLTAGLDDDGYMASNLGIMMPNDQLIESTFKLGIEPNVAFEAFLNVTTPYPAVSSLGLEFKLNREDNNNGELLRTINIKFNRNDRHYMINVALNKNDKVLYGSFEIDSPFQHFNNVVGNFSHTGSWTNGWKTEAALVVAKDWSMDFDSEAGKDKSELSISAIITTADDQFKFVRKPKMFEIRVPTPWSCVIHYDGSVLLEDAITFTLRRHHTCLPMTHISGNITLTMSEKQQAIVYAETPVPYLSTCFVNFTYIFDEINYLFDQREQPVSIYTTIEWEDSTLIDMSSEYKPIYLTAIEEQEPLPDDEVAPPDEHIIIVRIYTIGNISLVVNANSSKEYDSANSEVKTPYVDAVFSLKREGPWENVLTFDTSFEAKRKNQTVVDVVATYTPDETKVTSKVSYGGNISLGFDALSTVENGDAKMELKTPYVNVTFTLNREGPWKNPSNFEVQLSPEGWFFSIIDIYGSWDVANFPRDYNADIAGTIYGQVVEAVASGSIERPTFWEHEIRTFQIGNRMKPLSITTSLKDTAAQFKFKRGYRQKIEIDTILEPEDTGMVKQLTTGVKISQKGFIFMPFKSTSVDCSLSIPSKVNFASLKNGDIRKNLIEITKQMLSSMAWTQKIKLDSKQVYYTNGKLKIDMPKDENLGGLKIEYESSRALFDNKYNLIVLAFTPENATSANVKVAFDLNDEKIVHVIGNVEKRKSFSHYSRAKIDLDAPRKMSFDIERDGSNPVHQVVKANVNLDKTVDLVGTQWQLDVRQLDQAQSSGTNVAVTAVRDGKQMLWVETGYQFYLKPLTVELNLFGKTSNMPKKFGGKTKIALTGAVLDVDVWISSLARDIKLDMSTGRVDQARIFLNLNHDLGDPDRKLNAKISWQGDNVIGEVKCGPKLVNFTGLMDIMDKRNYRVTVKVADNDKNTADFVLKNSWDEATQNDTLEANLTTNNGYIQWTSHHYSSHQIQSRGILVQYHCAHWPEGEETVLYTFGEIDYSMPVLKFQLLTPFRTADYFIRTERRHNGVKEIKARLVGDNGNVSSVDLELDPTQPSFDLFSLHTDGSRFKLHGHVVSTQYAFIEAKSIADEGSSFENLLRMTVNVDNRYLNSSVRYLPELSQVMKDYVMNYRKQVSEVINRYQEHVPEGFKSIRHIKLLDEIVMPFVNTIKDDRRQLSENERIQWKVVTTEWFGSDDLKLMLGNSLPTYAESFANRWFAGNSSKGQALDNGKGLDMSVENAVYDISQAAKASLHSVLLPDWSKLRSLEVSELAESHYKVLAAVEKLWETTQRYGNEAYERFGDTVWTSCPIKFAEFAKAKLLKNWQKLSDREEFKKARDILVPTLSKLYQIFTAARRRYVASQTQNQPIRQIGSLYGKILAPLRDTVANSTFNFNPTTGYLNASVVLPSRELGTLRAPAIIAKKTEAYRQILERGVSSVQSRVTNHGPMSQLTLQRFYGAVQFYRAGELKLLPPLSAQALIIGSAENLTYDSDESFELSEEEPTNAKRLFRRQTHKRTGEVDLITFDGLGISLASPKSSEYRNLVLLYDRLRFAARLLLKIQKSGKWSVIVFVDNKKIEINAVDGKLFVDDQSIELPIQFTTTRVKRFGPEIQLQSRLGFEVICNIEYGYCRVIIDGIRYGTQAGILGTYTGDSADDLLSAGGNRLSAKRLGEFVCSWEAHRNASLCLDETESNRATKSMIIDKAKIDDAAGDDDDFFWLSSEAVYSSNTKAGDVNKFCNRLFQSSSSPLAGCFKKINPGPFLLACSARTHQHPFHRYRAPCGVAFAYAAHCRHAGVHIRPPKACVQCKPTKSALGRLLDNPRPQTVEIPLQAADVVFVIDEDSDSDCLQKNVPKLVAKLALELDDAFMKANFSNNRFGLVGFGGLAAHRSAHFHTVAGGNLWVSAEDMSQLEGDFTAKAKQAKKSPRKKPIAKGDALAAVELAVTSEWRIGAKRMIVLLSCSVASCRERKISLEALKAQFEINRIAMHFVGPSNLERIGSGQNLVGFDSRTLYTKENLPTGTSSLAMWRGFNKRPADVCSRLAVGMGGSYWSLGITSGSVDTVAPGLAARIARPSKTKRDCQQCACTLADYSTSSSYYDPEAMADCYRCLYSG